MMKMPEKPEPMAWNYQIVLNGSDGIVEGWFSTKSEPDPDDIPKGWDARIERVPVFTDQQLEAYGAAVREACAKHIEGMCGGQFRAAGWEIAASIRQED